MPQSRIAKPDASQSPATARRGLHIRPGDRNRAIGPCFDHDWQILSCSIYHCFSLLAPRKMMPNTIQYTGEQARSFAGVSPEAWRHWRKVVPSLSAKSGKKARFSAGELIALAIVAAAVGPLNVRVSGFAKRWDELFALCAQQRPGNLRSTFVIVTTEKVELVEARQLGCDKPVIVIPCEPIVDRLWTAAFSGITDQAQAPLPFAPQAVGGASR